MKLKITITGKKVHDVGYRPHLNELAMRLALRGFEVYNDEENGQQAVIALAEGDEQRVMKFYDLAMTKRPQLARVDSVRSEDYAGDVMPLWQSASINTASQINKAIPILQEIREYTSAIPQIKINTDQIPQINASTAQIPQILEEIKGLREDIQPGFATQFRRAQEDISAIKVRLGMS
jgi:acylphosphatase